MFRTMESRIALFQDRETPGLGFQPVDDLSNRKGLEVHTPQAASNYREPANQYESARWLGLTVRVCRYPTQMIYP